MLNLRPKVVISADPVTGEVEVKGKVAQNAYQYRTFCQVPAQVDAPTLDVCETPALIGFSTCVTCGALYAHLCLSCESGFSAR
jgi:hypothetical protein